MQERWITSEKEREQGGRKRRGGEGIAGMKRQGHGDSRGEKLSGGRDEFYQEYNNFYNTVSSMILQDLIHRKICDTVSCITLYDSLYRKIYNNVYSSRTHHPPTSAAEQAPLSAGLQLRPVEAFQYVSRAILPNALWIDGPAVRSCHVRCRTYSKIYKYRRDGEDESNR
jgi:hypothetical protein